MTAKEMVKITVNLAVIYIIGGLILAYVYSKASPIIFQKAKEEKEAALKTMMPEADFIEKAGDWEPHHKHAEYFIAKKCLEEKTVTRKDDQTGEISEVTVCIKDEGIGYVVEGFGKGYSSYINLYVSVDNNFMVKKVNILSHKETPGLGDEILKDSFLSQFAGKHVDNLVVIKGETEDKIEAITGATISSRAVAEDGTREGVKMLIEKLSGEAEK